MNATYNVGLINSSLRCKLTQNNNMFTVCNVLKKVSV